MGSGCCPGLVAKSFSGVSRCTQPDDVCTTMPEVYEAPPPQLPSGGTTTNPATLISQLESGSSTAFGSTSGLFKAGWFSDWRLSGLVGIVIVVMVISLAVMFGKAFNLPSVLAFADTEMRQAVISALLIFGLIGMMVFLDMVSFQAVYDMGLPVTCTTSEPCYFTVASTYLESVGSVAKETAFNQLQISVDNMAASSLGEQIQFNTYWVLFSGTSARLNAGLSMRAERASSLFETASSIISSIKAQEFFVKMAATTLAPAFLLLGIVLRTFFFTRKLGGLLLAIAVSLFFVYPLCYAFSWYTLNITVYGDRAFSTDDPLCPAECTAHFPVAFFVDKDGTGKIYQFDTTQKLMLAGITDQNWDSGDVNGDGDTDYYGLVACRDLTNAGISAPNSCGPYADGTSCPDYCREIPFPSNIPQCNATNCTSDKCNPGCKIVRQRMDCNIEGTCDPGANCPLGCRTNASVEDKCFLNDDSTVTEPVIPADFSVSCGGCVGCPYWCRFIKYNEEDGTYSQIFDSDDSCNKPECKPPEIDASGECPLKCQYVTKVGKSTLCDISCTLNGIKCPEFCRINGATDDPSFYEDYDITGVLDMCRQSGVLQACQKCPATCKITLSEPPNQPVPLEGCAPFPTLSQVSEKCRDCPEYCRYPDFSFITQYSNTYLTYTDIISPKPLVCAEGRVGGRINCEDNEGETGVCSDPPCKATQEPKTCREYSDISGEPVDYCRACPAAGRLVLQYESSFSGNIVSFPPNLIYALDTACGDTNCGADCKIVLTMVDPIDCASVSGGGGGSVDAMGLPESQDGPRLGQRGEGALFDVAPGGCNQCPEECRVYGGGIGSLLDPVACAECDDCDNACKAYYPGTDISCSEYVGNGPDGECIGVPACSNYGSKAVCTAHSDEGCSWSSFRVCTGTGAGNTCGTHADEVSCESDVAQLCSWVPIDTAYFCFGPAQSGTCSNHADAIGCAEHEECMWLPKDSPVVPLSYRTDYSEASNCKQCPENCRIEEYTGQCGNSDLGGGPVDCSYQSCSSFCRIPAMPETPSPPATVDQCDPYTSGSCEGCPLFCRRMNDKPIPYSLCYANGNCLSEAEGGTCAESCLLGDAPIRSCEQCFSCPLDCSYYPAVRTDCNELCDDSALAGPVNIGPGDFIKKLPGADGEADVKSVGTLLVVGLVMPLFCIVMVVAFIRVLSPVLGGDMDIPGLGRII